MFKPLSRVDTRSIEGELHEKAAEGRWGESEGEGCPVNIDDAIEEFQELRQELSRRRSHVSSAHGTMGRQKPKDEEEGGSVSDSSFFDLEEYLQRTNREKESSGIIPKKIGVSFRDLTVSGTGSGWKLVRTFPQELLSIFGYNIAKSLISKLGPKSPVKNIIQGFSGVVRPGEMLLVLGKPGSGSSTFLRALTNQRRDFTSIGGEVHYAGLPFELAKGQYRGEIMFNGEEDDHLPTLKVYQTLNFALKTKTPHMRTPGTTRSEFVIQMLDLFTSMFSMKHVLGTIVGNQYIRGVSGGERKRVSIMEALASRATINAFDNSTRGLDSSTAIDYIRSLRILTKLTAGTTIVTLYQAGEQIYSEFDKVCLIDDGRQIFFGKASEAREYFESLGFVAAPRITTSDFLTTITEAHERKVRPEMEGITPTTPEALEAAFRKSKYWTEVQEELAAYDQELEETSREDTKKFSQAVKQDKSKIAPKGSPYTVSFPLQVWYLLERELQLQMQDTVALRSKFLNVIILGLVIGGMFYNIPKTSEGAFSMGGVLFFNIIVVGWMQMIEAINMATGRSVAAKQTAFGFYRPSALILAKTIADVPVVAGQSIIFTMILYWMAGLAADAGKFFIQLLFVFSTVVCLTAFYRAIGAFSKDMNVSIRLAFLGLNVVALFAGYVQPFKNMKSWVYKWIFYVNPISYAQEAVMVNQFRGLELECSPSQLIPGVPGASIENQVCAVAGAEPMSKIVSGTRYIQQFNYSPDHIWRNFGILIAFTVLYIIVAMIGVETMSFGGSGGSTKILTKKPEEKQLPTTKSNEPTSNIENGSHGAAVPLGPTRTRASTVKTNGSAYSWNDVSYTIGSGANEKKLLHEINGYVKPGRITALMGPSGAGKTTLLDNLAFRKRVGVTTGKFLMNGKPLAADFERSTAFVEQQDVHDWSATVREALQFSALLRQPSNIPKEEKFAFVEEIIRLLELEPLADALIGKPGFGLSVEERKRVTIGVELAAAPQELMFLDEPTSGLDSNGALSIVRFLRKLADESGLAILCTIHQPSAILFQDFDDVLLLAKGGREVYFGPIGQAGTTVISYFQRHGAAPASADANPAEYILETIREAPGTQTWPEIWESSSENDEALQEIESIIAAQKDVPVNRELRTFEYAMPLSTQIKAVTKRVWLNYWRDASYGYSKVFSNLSMGIISGLLYFQSGNTVLEMQSRAFSAFMIMILSPMVITSIQPKFLEFRNLYEARERNSKIYSASAWLTAMALAEIPYAIFGTLFFYLPFYYMIGLPNDSNTAGYDFIFLMLFEIWISHVAMWIASMCKDMTIIINPFFFVITNGVTGIFVPYASLPRFYSSWLYWVNPLTWLARGMVGNVTNDVEVICGADELVTFQPPSGDTCGEYAGEWLSKAFGYIVDLNATQDCQYCQFKSGAEFLETINIQHSTRWREFGIFTAYLASNLVLVYVLYWTFREYRWGRLFARLRRTRSE
ncbi:ABC-2 type transporter-domain-containing protein [Geopyxis carbonaria]|nr:ABC-2 type transporter-domain-containing protein [Geopyxis carbonaria]